MHDIHKAVLREVQTIAIIGIRASSNLSNAQEAALGMELLVIAPFLEQF